MKCPNCEKEIEQTKGKRKKLFCNSTCRSNVWAKSKRKVTEKNPKNTQTNTKKEEPKDLPEIQARIVKIEEMLKLPEKYLNGGKRANLEKELSQLKYNPTNQ